jgi:maleylacetoacetate isomerase
MKLYTYYRSSAAYRVRIALNLKGLEHEDTFVHLRQQDQRAADYLAVNPQGLVPTLIDDDNTAIGQSLAILEYLEERYPQPPLRPGSPAGRARVRQLAMIVACDIHPIDNLKVLNFLTGDLGVDEAGRLRWYRHWVDEGFAAMEAILANQAATGTFCHGDSPTIADVCLVPQVYNAGRFEVDMAPYPTIRRINEACLALPAFADAAPEKQPDAE